MGVAGARRSSLALACAVSIAVPVGAPFAVPSVAAADPAEAFGNWVNGVAAGTSEVFDALSIQAQALATQAQDWAVLVGYPNPQTWQDFSSDWNHYWSASDSLSFAAMNLLWSDLIGGGVDFVGSFFGLASLTGAPVAAAQGGVGSTGRVVGASSGTASLTTSEVVAAYSKVLTDTLDRVQNLFRFTVADPPGPFPLLRQLLANQMANFNDIVALRFGYVGGRVTSNVVGLALSTPVIALLAAGGVLEMPISVVRGVGIAGGNVLNAVTSLDPAGLLGAVVAAPAIVGNNALDGVLGMADVPQFPGPLNIAFAVRDFIASSIAADTTYTTFDASPTAPSAAGTTSTNAAELDPAPDSGGFPPVVNSPDASPDVASVSTARPNSAPSADHSRAMKDLISDADSEPATAVTPATVAPRITHENNRATAAGQDTPATTNSSGSQDDSVQGADHTEPETHPANG